MKSIDPVIKNVKNVTNNLYLLVSQMKIIDSCNKTYMLKKINNEKTLTGKCILARNFLTPQSSDFEAICKKDLGISNTLNSTSGDGHKNGNNYEIKTSIHAKKSKLNFVQLRPDHNIDYYIFIAYNMYETDTLGNAHIFKVPSQIVYDLIVRFGGYAHGTCEILGKITPHNIKGRNCEYALRCNPNTKKGKSYDIWNEFMKYKVEYSPNNF